MLPLRAKPPSVMLRSAASSIASELGAPTPTRIGRAGHRGLLHQLVGEPAADAEHAVRPAGAAPRPAPSRSPCRSRCGGRRPRARSRSSPPASKRPAAWRPPVRAKAGWRRRSGRSASSSRETRGPSAATGAQHRDLLERAPAADPAGGGRVEAAGARIAQQRPRDLDDVGGEVLGRPGLVRRGRSGPRRGGSRAPAPRRGRGCASSPPAARRRRGSRAAPRPRPRRCGRRARPWRPCAVASNRRTSDRRARASDGCSATGRTSTATTLYSGQEVLTSAELPTSRLVRASGKWKLVKTWPGSIRSVTCACSSIRPTRLRTETWSPSPIQSRAASSGWISSQSRSTSSMLPVRRVIVPAL